MDTEQILHFCAGVVETYSRERASDAGVIASSLDDVAMALNRIASALENLEKSDAA